MVCSQRIVFSIVSVYEWTTCYLLWGRGGSRPIQSTVLPWSGPINQRHRTNLLGVWLVVLSLVHRKCKGVFPRGGPKASTTNFTGRHRWVLLINYGIRKKVRSWIIFLRFLKPVSYYLDLLPCVFWREMARQGETGGVCSVSQTGSTCIWLYLLLWLKITVCCKQLQYNGD